MNKFEEDLKLILSAPDTQVINWMQHIGQELIKQKEYSYGQEFLKSQQKVYDLIFQSDGLLNRSFQQTQKRLTSIEDTITYFKLLHQLSPEEFTFYSALPSDLPLNSLQTELLPAHLQLFIKDQSIVHSNPQFTNFQEVFKNNLIVEKGENKFYINAKLTFWIYLLNAACNFKESAIYHNENNQKIINSAFNKIKRRINTKDYMLKQLIFNPYAIIIRRILDKTIFQIKSASNVTDSSKQITILMFQQMIILLQEFSLYEHIYVSKLQPLHLTVDQNRIFMKIKPTSVILDTQVMLIFLTILFNSIYGQDLESIFSQYKPFMKKNEMFQSKSNLIVNYSRGFFFECGRQKQYITYQQALYQLFQYIFDVYYHERQCNQLSLLTHISTYILFLRWQYAKYEISLLQQAQIFDDAILQCFIQGNRRINNPKAKIEYRGTNPIQKFIINDMLPVWTSLIDKFGESTIQQAFKQFKPPQVLNIYESKYFIKQYSIDYHCKELEPYKSQMNNQIRIYYPFYTKLLLIILKSIYKLQSINESEYQGIMHLITFMYSEEKDSIYSGLLKFIPQKPFQTPPYQEVKNFCDEYDNQSNEDNFLIQQNDEIQEYISKLIAHIKQYQQYNHFKDERIINFLGELFQIRPVSIKPQPLNKSPIKYSGRLSHQRISINQWKAPLRDYESSFLFFIMWHISQLFDLINKKEKQEFPQTQWPRKFASPINLFILITIILIFGMFIYKLF